MERYYSFADSPCKATPLGRFRLQMIVLAAVLGWGPLSWGVDNLPLIQISYDDPQARLAPFRATLDAHIQAAALQWIQVMNNPLGTMDVLVRADLTIPRATGRSLTSSQVGTSGLFSVFEMGATWELKTGDDPNGPSHDVEFSINPNYVANELWFDPAPSLRTATVSSFRTDAMSVFLHEWGHALGVNGWLNALGGLPGDYMSTFDDAVVSDGTDLYFSGTNAQDIYGSAVPITFNNPNHIGNNAPRPGQNLTGDLMNGVVFQRGTRYEISALDLAILSDSGVPIRFPIRASDLNLDGSVDAADASKMFAQWSSSAYGIDVNYDGIVDAADAGRLFGEWTGDSFGEWTGASGVSSLRSSGGEAESTVLVPEVGLSTWTVIAGASMLRRSRRASMVGVPARR